MSEKFDFDKYIKEHEQLLVWSLFSDLRTLASDVTAHYEAQLKKFYLEMLNHIKKEERLNSIINQKDELLDKFCLRSQAVTVLHRANINAKIQYSDERWKEKLNKLYDFQCEVEDTLRKPLKIKEV
jgi:hypothetical protein